MQLDIEAPEEIVIAINIDDVELRLFNICHRFYAQKIKGLISNMTTTSVKNIKIIQ